MLYKISWMARALIYALLFDRVGMMSYIGPPIFITGWRKISIGKRVRIFPAARLEVHGEGRLLIKDNVSIGNDLHLACAATLTIGSGVQISSAVLLTDIDHEYEDISRPIFEQPLVVRPTTIGDRCFIGAGVKILAGTTLGQHCVVGANSVVRGVFPDFTVIAGAPARIVRRLDPASGKWIKVQ